MPTLTPPFSEFLPGWLARQRWYTAKGRTPQLRRVGGLRYQDPAGEVGIETWLLLDEAGPRPVLYQVPLTYRGAPVEGLEHALLAQAEHSELGPRWIYDGCHDPVGAWAILDAITAGRDVVADGGPQYGTATGHRASGPGALGTPTGGRRSRVLTGEQSNTSIIFEGDDGAPVICKVFRVLAGGENPEVVVQLALADAGSTRVPAPLGALAGAWPGADGTSVHGHLAFAQEFLPGVEDAWRVALRAAADGADFGARELGRAVASVHRDLAAAFPTSEATPQVREALLRGWQQRAEQAQREVPELADRAAAVLAVYERTAHVPWPPLQRIHGDLHLGQVIEAPGRGWQLLDFEGEPLRPLAERAAPDLALRDVAGMLRSLDYAAGAAHATSNDAAGADAAGADAAEAGSWTRDAREAFLTGYAEESGRDPRADRELLGALELDKALYEVTYEARNRPDWLALPLAGVARLLDEDRPAAP